MARRAATSVESDDSLKENTNSQATQSNVKPKTEKVKKEKASTKGKQKESATLDADVRGDVDEQDELDDEAAERDEGDCVSEEDGEDGGQSPKGRKRARVSVEGDARPMKGESKGKGKSEARSKAYIRDEDGYVAGSIVRVQLKNFVTYDFTEFTPGPHLNMILGPNGTGKSSIACALCLGLNFPTSILGRASELPSFVKLGHDSGYIEIELKAKPGNPNLVIQRNLSAKSKGSTFTINGKTATAKEVNKEVGELNVGVNNLCSFLPQDKVAEFARMSPQELLRETQRAAGDEQLSAWHQTLIDAGKELGEFNERINAEREQLKTMEERNKILEKDVDRYNERKRIEHKIDLLELTIPFREYIEAKERYTETKEAQRRAHERVLMLKKRNEPAHRFMAELDKQKTTYDRERSAKKDDAKKKFQDMKGKYNENEKLESEVQEIQNRLDGLKKREKDRAKQISDLEKRINNTQNDLDSPPDMEDMETLLREIREVQDEQAKVKQRHNEHLDKQKANIEDGAKCKADIDMARKGLRQLSDASHRRLQALAQIDPDCAAAVKWVRENRSRFKMDIVEPAFISLTVPNKAYVAAVESCFNRDTLTTFVAQCEEDVRLLNRLVNDTPEALGRKVNISTWFRPNEERTLLSPPLNEEEMRRLGFDGYVIDYVECPNGLIWYLQKHLNLHRTPVALNGNGVDVDRAMEMVSRLGPNGEGGGANFIAGTTVNKVSRSKYGKRLPQNSVGEVRKPRAFANEAVDPRLTAEFEQKIGQGQIALEVVEKDTQALAHEEQQIRIEANEFKTKLDDLQARKLEVQSIKTRLQRLRVLMEQNIKKLEDLRNAPSVDAERASLKNRLLDRCRKRAKLSKDYVELVRAAIRDQAEATEKGLEYLQTCSNMAALQTKIKASDADLERAMQEYAEADRAFTEAKKESKAKLFISRAKLDSVDQELRDEFADMERSGRAHEKSSDELHTELETARQELAMNLNTNAGVIEQFERRKQDIEVLSQTIEARQRKIDRVERNITNARDNWEPSLEKLVASIGEKFSAAFDRIGCAGEIRIRRHEDFDKWAIDILVKFRDSEKLQLLTGQRQSGGERSLTTILYLMSLTEQARAPFSLVDEINQGMDGRAERAVHNELVQVTCKADSGQYFLITPKLLPDLRYDERMKILCVNNGEWLPDETGLGKLMSMIDSFVARKSRSAASA